MKISKILPILLILVISGCQQAIDYAENAAVDTKSGSRAVTAKPFPQNLSTNGLIKPDVPQGTMTSQIKSYYDSWKQKYGTPYSFTGGRVDGTGDGYVIKGEANGGTWNWPSTANTISTSEAHGYGMMIFALMAGYDSEAKQLFDKMYKTKVNFPSLYSKNLTSWVFPIGGDLTLQNQPCASDGDMDIAYALLLADKQWGGGPEGYNITYKQAAIDMINDLASLTILTDSGKYFPRLGTSDSIYGPYYPVRGTRPSDFMIGHMDVFAKVAPRSAASWTSVMNGTIDIVDFVQSNMASNTGLMPEFLANKGGNFNVDIQTYEGISDENGGSYDNTFYSNACRFPWRYSMGYAQTKSSRVKTVLDNFNTWLIAKHNNNGVYDPGQTRAGYLLNGQFDTRHAAYTDLGTKAGFMAALAASKDVNSLTAAWNNNRYFQNPDQWSTYYYQNSINLLTMLYVSGNFWSPVDSGDTGDTEPPKAGMFYDFTKGSTTFNMVWRDFTDNVGIVRYDAYIGEKQGPEGVANTFVGSTTNTNWTYTNLQPNNSRYWIEVCAVDAAGNTSERIGTFISTLNETSDTQPPTSVTSITGNLDGNGNVNLSWNPSTDNVGVVGYVAYIHNKHSRNGAAIKYPVTNNVTFTAAELTSKFSDIDTTALPVYEVKIKAKDAAENYSGWVVAEFDFRSSGDVPKDSAATSKPSSFSLTKDNWSGNSTYKIIANMWYGQNATVVKLYENGVLVETLKPTFATPSAQKVKFSFSGKPIGTYVYKIDAINQHGTTTSSNFTYTVTQ